MPYRPHSQTGVPQGLAADAIRAVAAKMRRAAIARQGPAWELRTGTLAAIAMRLRRYGLVAGGQR
ncbi:MAG: hypothetical protein J0H99_03695 [Rhodospirillales bacterium]|nr:hypothetical protein [Rhodospirillales bacterium]